MDSGTEGTDHIRLYCHRGLGERREVDGWQQNASSPTATNVEDGG